MFRLTVEWDNASTDFFCNSGNVPKHQRLRLQGNSFSYFEIIGNRKAKRETTVFGIEKRGVHLTFCLVTFKFIIIFFALLLKLRYQMDKSDIRQ